MREEGRRQQRREEEEGSRWGEMEIHLEED